MSQLFSRIREYLPAPTAASNKYSLGVPGFVTGSVAFPGAALLGVQAAQAAGVGMVRYFGPASVSSLILSEHPEVVCSSEIAAVEQAINAWVLGSGVPADDEFQLANIAAALATGSPAVLDAAAMYTLDLAPLLPGQVLLTPHNGEFARLLERYGVSEAETRAGLASIDGRIVLAKRAQEFTGQTILLKGSHTVICGGSDRVSVIGPNSAHLATAGSGDVLAGLLGALAARNPAASWFELAQCTVELHSQAAESAAELGPVTASSIACGIWQVIAKALAA